jgi:Mg-chelatase subunit ChlD
MTTKKPTKAKKKVTTTVTTVTTTTEEVLPSTHITLVVDRSGSMDRIDRDMESQIESFLREQRQMGGECHLTVVLFNNTIEVLHDNIDIARVSHVAIRPHGGTALNDATVYGIKHTDRSKAEKKIVVIVTDGEENASREYTALRVREEIEKRSDWAFMFFGTETAFRQARDYGVSSQNVMSYQTNAVGVMSAGGVLRSATSNYRKGLASNQALFADPKALK